jgi:hypothetical protein
MWPPEFCIGCCCVLRTGSVPLLLLLGELMLVGVRLLLVLVAAWFWIQLPGPKFGTGADVAGQAQPATPSSSSTYGP